MIVEFQGVHSVRLLKKRAPVYAWNRSLKMNFFEIRCFRQTIPRMNMFSSTAQMKSVIFHCLQKACCKEGIIFVLINHFKFCRRLK